MTANTATLFTIAEMITSRFLIRFAIIMTITIESKIVENKNSIDFPSKVINES